MSNLKNVFRKGKSVVVAGGAVAMTAAGNTMAAVPVDVTDALTTAKADGTTIAGTVLGVIIAIAVFRYIRKAL